MCLLRVSGCPANKSSGAYAAAQAGIEAQQRFIQVTHCESGMVNPGSFNGTHFGGIKQCDFMVNLRDFPLMANSSG